MIDNTIILNYFRRPSSLEYQLETLEKQSVQSKEIIIWCNEGGYNDKLPPIANNYTVIKSGRNYKYHARFALGLLHDTEYISYFDDDTIPGKDWFKSCIECMKIKEGMYGTIGVILNGKHYVKNSKVGWFGKNNEEITQVDLIGHSWFLKREWLNYMWRDTPLSFINGEDIQLSYRILKYGGIKTYVPPHPINNKDIWGSQVEYGKKVGNDNNCSLKSNNEHYEQRNELVRDCIDDGWVTVKGISK